METPDHPNEKRNVYTRTMCVLSYQSKAWCLVSWCLDKAEAVSHVHHIWHDLLFGVCPALDVAVSVAIGIDDQQYQHPSLSRTSRRLWQAASTMQRYQSQSISVARPIVYQFYALW